MASKTPATLTSGELAKLLGLGVSTIHDHIESGFFSEPPRTPGGHRRFSADTVLSDYRRAGHEAPAALVDYRKRFAKASRKVGRFAGVSP